MTAMKPSVDGIDSGYIRETYETIISAVALSAGDRDLLGLRVLGHVQLLLPEVDAIEPRLQGIEQAVARHVLAETRRILPTLGAPGHLRDMAVQCRALLSLQELADRTAR